MSAWIYILRCSDGSYYTGSTSNLERRIYEHQYGYYPEGYTYSRRPIELVYSLETENYDKAFKLERQIKGWSRKKKEALINGDFELLHELAECKNPTNYRNIK